MAHKILIIEDKSMIRKLLSSSLEKEGYQVMLAGDGDEGLLEVKKEFPNLIILDVYMPKMNGYEFITDLKTMLDDIPPIIMLTASTTVEKMFRLEGIAEYFIKPVNIPKLIEKIRECLGPNPVKVSRGKERILIIDNSGGAAIDLKTNLEATDKYEVKLVNEAAKILPTAMNYRPDLILLEIMFNRAQVIKSHETLKDTPIVIWTNSITNDEMESLGGFIAGYPVIIKNSQLNVVLKAIEANIKIK